MTLQCTLAPVQVLAGTRTDKVHNTAYRLEELENLMLSKDPNSLQALEVRHPLAPHSPPA
jgi:hypothetical protein